MQPQCRLMNPDSTDKTDISDDAPSKSALKRDSTAKQKIGETLATLSASRLEQLDLPATLHRALLDLKRLMAKGSRAHGGMKRQKQYVGKLMRQIDVEPLETKLREWAAETMASKELSHQIEQWRDRLIHEGTAAIDVLYEDLQLDDQTHRQSLRQLIRQANKEKQANKSPKAARVLFKLLRDDIFANAPTSQKEET
ncbi:MAG: DUF615 domain-containing protein [Gammaproteobacteria bacterium]|nr:DUF615 domain-containing protein [Gammaproteobacteria bacterium]